MLPSRCIDTIQSIHTDMLLNKVRLDSALRIYEQDLSALDKEELQAIHTQLGDVEYSLGSFAHAKRCETENHYIDQMGVK